MSVPASFIHLLTDGTEIARRRTLVPPGQVVEAWADRHVPGLYWVGDESKTLLDSVGPAIAPDLSVPADAVPVFYGPLLCDIDALPPEESLKARVLSAHGVAVAWITLDRFGQRANYEPQSPGDPVFHLRRRRTQTTHLWRLFGSKPEAIAYMAEAYGRDAEGYAWAEALPENDFDALIKRHRAP